MPSNSVISPVELQEVAGRIRLLRQKATEHAVEIGRELLRVKASLQHGVFVKWVEKECEFKIRTAQDLMKLAREAESNADVAAVMVPSTLRVYLSNSTPSAVRQLVKARLQSGQQISRKELHSAIAEAKAKQARECSSSLVGRGNPAIADLLSVGGTEPDSEIDRARRIAELLVRRLSASDYEFVMSGINWGIWNRVLVWLRTGRRTFPDRIEAVQPQSVAKAPAA